MNIGISMVVPASTSTNFRAAASSSQLANQQSQSTANHKRRSGASQHGPCRHELQPGAQANDVTSTYQAEVINQLMFGAPSEALKSIRTLSSSESGGLRPWPPAPALCRRSDLFTLCNFRAAGQLQEKSPIQNTLNSKTLNPKP